MLKELIATLQYELSIGDLAVMDYTRLSRGIWWTCQDLGRPVSKDSSSELAKQVRLYARKQPESLSWMVDSVYSRLEHPKWEYRESIKKFLSEMEPNLLEVSELAHQWEEAQHEQERGS